MRQSSVNIPSSFIFLPSPNQYRIKGDVILGLLIDPSLSDGLKGSIDGIEMDILLCVKEGNAVERAFISYLRIVKRLAKMKNRIAIKTILVDSKGIRILNRR